MNRTDNQWIGWPQGRHSHSSPSSTNCHGMLLFDWIEQVNQLWTDNDRFDSPSPSRVFTDRCLLRRMFIGQMFLHLAWILTCVVTVGTFSDENLFSVSRLTMIEIGLHTVRGERTRFTRIAAIVALVRRWTSRRRGQRRRGFDQRRNSRLLLEENVDERPDGEVGDRTNHRFGVEWTATYRFTRRWFDLFHWWLIGSIFMS